MLRSCFTSKGKNNLGQTILTLSKKSLHYLLFFKQIFMELFMSSCTTGNTVTQDQIETQAYLKWEAAGYPASDGVEFWLEAEKELNLQAACNAAKARIQENSQNKFQKAQECSGGRVYGQQSTYQNT